MGLIHADEKIVVGFSKEKVSIEEINKILIHLPSISSVRGKVGKLD